MADQAEEQAGQVTNHPNLATEGPNEPLAGEVPKKAGHIEKVFEK
jgi:uncharacterized protein YjbJ (UPF0337 family)